MTTTPMSRGLAHLVRIAQPARLPLAGATAFAIAAVAAVLSFPIFVRRFVDEIATGTVQPASVMLLAGVLVGSSVAFTGAAYLLARVGHRVVAALRTRLIDKMLRLKVESFDRESTGARVSRVLSDCDAIAELVTRHAINLLTGVLLLAGAVTVMLVLDVRLTLALLACVAAAFGVVVPVSFVLDRLSRRIQDRTAALGGILTHVFAEIRLVKAYTAEARERARCQQEVEQIRDLGMKVARTSAALEPLMSFASSAAIVVILVYGTLRVSHGEISIGTLTAFILYIFSIANPLIQLTQFTAGLQKARGASVRIGEILREPDEAAALPDAPAQRHNGALEFRQVSFAYPGHEAMVLRGIDLVFRPGTTTALVGASGNGKTTILSLIERFYEPTHGEILHNGAPVAAVPLAEWRRRIGYVAQGAPIMPGSVRDNIVYGLAGEFSDAAVRHAAEQAGAWSFIECMPLGLDTLLIEQGNNLSGGQRQRIAIARMFLRDPDILILDEATSNLDSETEHQVRVALEALMRGRTNVIVAHRLSTVMHADRIYFLESGRISGAGNHSELIASHPYYARLVARQFREPAQADAVLSGPAE
jgi:ATP-binding cassette subfamily B protein AbcA/BmrA